MIDLAPLVARIPARCGVYCRALDGGWSTGDGGELDFPAASVIKVPIFLELYRRVQAGELSLEQRVTLRAENKSGGAGVLLELHEGLELTLEDLGRLMLVVSDNTASNLLLDLLGMDALNASMQRWGMKGTRFGRRFMEPATPTKDNRMTAADAGRCLEMLWRGEIIGEPLRTQALDTLKRQQYREKIPLMLPHDLPIAHKTGELDGVRHDAALIEHPAGPYVLVVFTEHGANPWDVDRGIAELSLALYNAHPDPPHP